MILWKISDENQRLKQSEKDKGEKVSSNKTLTNLFLTIGGSGLIYWTFDHLKKNGSLSKTSIVLYDLESCPYCQKVRSKLEDLNVSYKRKSVDVAKNKKELSNRRLGKTTVPYIEIDGQGFEESEIIVELLEERFGE